MNSSVVGISACGEGSWTPHQWCRQPTFHCRGNIQRRVRKTSDGWIDHLESLMWILTPPGVCLVMFVRTCPVKIEHQMDSLGVKTSSKHKNANQWVN